jgi:phage shock protein PspC (stress-responsive transcriptional regulator)
MSIWHWIVVIVIIIPIAGYIVAIIRANKNTSGSEPKGIYGWLILVAIGLPLTPLMLLGHLIGQLDLIDKFAQLPTGLVVFIMIEMIFNLCLLALSLYIVYAFIKNKSRFPSLFIAFLIISLVGQIVDLTIAADVFGIKMQPSDTKELIRSVLGAAIWIPYMIKSRRVQNTFTL